MTLRLRDPAEVGPDVVPAPPRRPSAGACLQVLLGGLLAASLVTQWCFTMPALQRATEAAEKREADAGRRLEQLRQQDELLKSIQVKAATIQVLQDRTLKGLKGGRDGKE